MCRIGHVRLEGRQSDGWKEEEASTIAGELAGLVMQPDEHGGGGSCSDGWQGRARAAVEVVSGVWHITGCVVYGGGGALLAAVFVGGGLSVINRGGSCNV